MLTFEEIFVKIEIIIEDPRSQGIQVHETTFRDN